MKKTSLMESNPELAREWHTTKNGDLKPTDVTAGSNKKVWWLCQECGQEWQATISNRSRGHGCPYCAGRLPIVGETDLATVNPELTKEWHTTKNGDLKPADVTENSGKRVWWRCKEGHEWKATICNRSSGRGCPYCARKLPIVVHTTQVCIPELAKVARWLKREGHFSFSLKQCFLK